MSWKISDKEVWVCDLPVFQSLDGADMTQGLLREMGVVEPGRMSVGCNSTSEWRWWVYGNDPQSSRGVSNGRWYPRPPRSAEPVRVFGSELAWINTRIFGMVEEPLGQGVNHVDN